MIISKKILTFVLLAFWAPMALAIAPYFEGTPVPAGDRKAVVAEVEKKLTARGFKVVGVHYPKGVDDSAVVVVTDPGLMQAIDGLGGRAIVGAGIRVGVTTAGKVSWINPEYWYRAWFRGDYDQARRAVKGVSDRLSEALGRGKGFGGDEAPEDLPGYNYMIGMEKFDSKRTELRKFASYDEAVRTIRDNLAAKVADTAAVYEITLPGSKLAVFGVAMNDPETGEGWWVNKVGKEHIAALPWEIFVVDDTAYALYGRYRTALGWPELGMGTFMTISDHPDATLATLVAVTGGSVKRDDF